VERTNSSFKTVSRKPLHNGTSSELGDIPDVSITRPRSACTVNLASNISREQRNKTTKQGAPYGSYTLQLSYNRDGNNDLAIKPSYKIQDDGTYAPTASGMKMEFQRNRPGLNDGPQGPTNFDKTPGLEKLGLSQATWGSDEGWVGGTEETLTCKRSSGVAINHIDRQQRSKTGFGSYRDTSMDVWYDVNDRLVHPRPKCGVTLAKAKKRETMDLSSETVDKSYDWEKVKDRRHVVTPNIDNYVDRETRQKQGFGSGQDSLADLMYNHEKINSALAHRVRTPDIDKLTSRDPPSLLPPDKYKDQLCFGKGMRDLGDLGTSPVFGSPAKVPDIGRSPTRFPVKKKKASEGQQFRL